MKQNEWAEFKKTFSFSGQKFFPEISLLWKINLELYIISPQVKHLTSRSDSQNI
jgi:hypothetical protein